MSHRKNNKKQTLYPEGSFAYKPGPSRSGMMQSDLDEDDDIKLTNDELVESNLRKLIRKEVFNIFRKSSI